jgi:uncharacterized membrane protein YqjE
MAFGPTPSHGLLDDLRGLFGSLFDLAGRRIELFTIEAQEEKARLLDLAFRAAAVLVLSWMALVTATATLVVAFWDTHPVIVLVVVTLAYGGTAAVLALSLRRRLRQASRPFAGTIEELRKDRECFGTKN